MHGHGLAAALLKWLLLASLATASTALDCAPGCTKYGTCNLELGRCDCPRHRTGDDCSQLLPLDHACPKYGFGSDAAACTAETPLRCVNACSSRGTCTAGWCHCQPGHYGTDCSLSLGSDGVTPVLLSGLGYKPSPNPPRIYVYELPPRFNTWRNIDKFDRPLYSQLLKRITSSGHRTTDGGSADYYYLPVDFRYLFSDAIRVLEYVQQTWPYWNATGGARHLLLSTSDLGGCEGAQLMRIRGMTEKAVWLTAWGLTRKHPRVWWPGCHRPGLDIVIPIPAQTPQMLRTPLNPKAPKPARNISFYFSGKICGDNRDPKTDGSWPVCQTRTNPLYSAGVRQLVFHHHAQRPGYKVVTRSATYIHDMASARFCLAPTGGGHGKRQVLVGRFGCIPVPITDFVLQPFEPELDWESFAVTVPEAEIPRMHEILEGISDAKLAQMQAALACAAKHLWWSTLWGGIFGEDGRYDAFATIMEILRVRLAHPDAQPQDYAKVDERWRKFSTCQLDDDPPMGTVQLCTYSNDEGVGDLAPTPMCDGKQYGKYGIPGGAVCQGAPNLAQCPRPW